MEQKNIIILGATSGIGHALANIYSQHGAQLGIAARRTDILKEMAQKSSDIFYVPCDVQQPVACIEALQQLVQLMGGHVDLFILCTGVGQMNVSLNHDVEQNTILTNVVGWTAVVDWIFTLFMQQKHGHLAAISSIASLRGLGPAPSYSATKAYQAHYLESLQQIAMASGHSIYVTNIRPGFVDTPLLAHPEKFFWVVPVEKAARQIVCALDKKKSNVTVTRRWKLLVPIILHVPNWLIAKIVKRVM